VEASGLDFNLGHAKKNQFGNETWLCFVLEKANQGLLHSTLHCSSKGPGNCRGLRQLQAPSAIAGFWQS